MFRFDPVAVFDRMPADDPIAICDRISAAPDDAVTICDRIELYSTFEPKREVGRKLAPIPAKRLIENSCGDAINACKIEIQHNLLITNRQNSNVRRLFLVATKQFISPFNYGVETYSQDHRNISRSKMWSHIATTSNQLG